MRTSKQIANELLVHYADAIMLKDKEIFNKKLSSVFEEVVIKDVEELRKLRNVQYDAGLVGVFKDQRQKYASICVAFNKGIKSDLLKVTDFDEVVKEIYPSVYEWYCENVLDKN